MVRTRLILDANVLIDFCRTDATLLTSFNRHVGRVHVASPVLAKVDQLDADGADRLGLVVVEPPLELAMEAASRAQRSPLAFDDWICLLMGKAQGWTCVTNDKRLRRECAAAKVDVLWGLELVLELVRAYALTPDAAEEVVWAIHRMTPRFVPEKIVREFVARMVQIIDARDDPGAARD